LKRARILLINTALLTAISLLMRTVALSFQVWLSSRIGPEGVGLFGLIMSVYNLALTLAFSGLRLAATRTVSRELGLGRAGGIKAALSCSLSFAALTGIAASLLLFFGAEFFSRVWISSSDAALSLRLLSFSLPFVAMSSVLGGYFTAVTRVAKSALVSVFEQFVRIAVTVLLFSSLPPNDLKSACAAIVLGSVISDILSFLILLCVYLCDIRRYFPCEHPASAKSYRHGIFSIAAPVALSMYSKTALSTCENLLVPLGLERSGASSQNAIASYGIIQGMVVPLITFPCALLTVLAELIIPELTESQAAGKKTHVNYILNRVFKLSLLFSAGASVLFLCFSEDFGIAVYNSSEAGRYIRLLALLALVTYLDSIVDGMLKGLGEFVSAMRYSILDSFLGVILVWSLLPVFGVNGYIFNLIFTKLVNFLLSLFRLMKVSRLRVRMGDILSSLLCAFTACAVTSLPFLAEPPSPAVLAAKVILSCFIYLFFLFLTSLLSGEDRVWMRSLIKNPSHSSRKKA